MSRKITLEAMKKALPPGTKGIAYCTVPGNYVEIKQHERMTFADFLKISSKLKGKNRTISYWTTRSTGPDFKGGSYYEVIMTVKINGKQNYNFLTTEKVLNSGKRSYVNPTQRNSYFSD